MYNQGILKQEQFESTLDYSKMDSRENAQTHESENH